MLDVWWGGRQRAAGDFLEVERFGYDLEPQEANALNLRLLNLAAGSSGGQSVVVWWVAVREGAGWSPPLRAVLRACAKTRRRSKFS